MWSLQSSMHVVLESQLIRAVPREKLSETIEALAEHLAQFEQVAQMKSAPSYLRDRGSDLGRAR